VRVHLREIGADPKLSCGRRRRGATDVSSQRPGHSEILFMLAVDETTGRHTRRIRKAVIISDGRSYFEHCGEVSIGNSASQSANKPIESSQSGLHHYFGALNSQQPTANNRACTVEEQQFCWFILIPGFSPFPQAQDTAGRCAAVEGAADPTARPTVVTTAGLLAKRRKLIRAHQSSSKQRRKRRWRGGFSLPGVCCAHPIN
jgi:hypothetical protein